MAYARNIILAFTLLISLTAMAAAQDAAPAAQSEQAAPSGPEVLPIPEAAQPMVSFDPQKATDAYLSLIKGEAREKSDEYFEGGYVLQPVEVGYGLAVAALLLWGGFSARMRNLAQRVTRLRFFQVPVYALMYFVAAAVLTFPYTVYVQFFREHEYGLSNQNFAGWFGDFTTLFGVSLLFLIVLVTIVYAFIRWTKERWWIWGTVISVAFLAFATMVAPVYINPLVNDYKPLAEGPLKEDILSMARANGVLADNVWEFNASKQTKRISANVSGLFGTTRISLNDNLLNRSTREEIRAVMGHELGHYVLGHVYALFSTFLVIIFVALGFTHWAFKRLTSAFGKQWGVQSIDDPAGMPVIFALLSVFFFAATPVLNTLIRTGEAEADIFGLNVAREADGFATVALKLAEYRKLDPEPWEEFVYYDHPSGRSRISMAMYWKAEHLDELRNK
ncbi:MAG: M48 family metallopeptidase [Alphaproteobacteria bacterium]